MIASANTVTAGGKQIPENQLIQDAKEYVKHHGGIVVMTNFCKWAYGFMPTAADHVRIADVLDKAKIPRKVAPRPITRPVNMADRETVFDVNSLYFAVTASHKGVAEVKP